MYANNHTTFRELVPTDSHKSFYGKALVCTHEDGTETLLSYGTPIIDRTPAGELIPRWNGWSATTGRHIKAFCGLNKSEYFKLAGWEKSEACFDYFDHLDSHEAYVYVADAKYLCRA